MITQLVSPAGSCMHFKQYTGLSMIGTAMEEGIFLETGGIIMTFSMDIYCAQ